MMESCLALASAISRAIADDRLASPLSRSLHGAAVSIENPPPRPPWIIPVIIVAVNLATLVILGSLGALQQLSPAAQFYFGAATFAFPLIVYLILKKRRERDGE